MQKVLIVFILLHIAGTFLEDNVFAWPGLRRWKTLE